MNKNVLKSLLTAVTPGTKLDISFIPDPLYSGLSGTYEVISSKPGRGKCASRVLVVKNVQTGKLLDKLTVGGKEKAFGTPVSEVIMNVVHEGVKYGEVSAAQLPNAYPRSEEAAGEFSKVFDSLIGKYEGSKLKIDSTVPEFNGEWTFVSGRVIAGRHGQRILTLQRDGVTTELWSYRHSGVINGIELLLEE